MGCCDGYCKKCHGMVWGLAGVIILINRFVWPQWLGIDGWLAFFGLILIIAGIWKSLMPTCGCNPSENCCAPVKEVKKKK